MQCPGPSILVFGGAESDMVATMKEPDEYTEQEAAQRRDKVLSVMLSTPPQPHAAKGKSRVGKAEEQGKVRPK